MRKIVGVLIGVMLLLMVGQAGAVDNGTGDPLGLISSAVIQPFWNATAAGDFTLIEVTSPIGDNGLSCDSPDDCDFSAPFLEVVYFDANCFRVTSHPYRVSWKGAIVFSPQFDTVGACPGPFCTQITGLAVITNSFTGSVGGNTAIPDTRAIHVRGHWLNFGQDFIREVDPIAVSSTQSGVAPNKQSYSPLRSAASFGFPVIDSVTFTGFLHLICPGNQIPVELSGTGFPPAPATAFGVSRLVHGFVYDFFEHPQISYDLFCICQTMFDLVLDISPIYALIDTYTELYTYSPTPFAPPTAPTTPTNPLTFMGYRAISVSAGVWPGGSGDDFGRLNNGSAYNYRVNGQEPSFGPNQFVPGLR